MAQVAQLFLVTQSTAKHLPWQVQPLLYQLKPSQIPPAQIPDPIVLSEPEALPPSSLCP